MKKTVRFLVNSIMAFGVLLVSSQAFAAEPENNTIPSGSYTGRVEFYQWIDAVGEKGGPDIAISPAGDVDYVVVSCAGRRPVNSAGIRIYPYSSSIDLDVEVYDLSGNYLGGSYGTGALEGVDVRAFGQQSVIMKVYGFNGSVGTYDVMGFCQPV